MSNTKHSLAREYSISETILSVTSCVMGFNDLFRGIMYVGGKKKHKKYTKSNTFKTQNNHVHTMHNPPMPL
jgi:hypothetical protein